MARFPQMSFPSADELAKCGPWCRPLHLVEAAVAGQPFAQYFSVDDFMCMGMLRRRRRPDLLLAKHVHTRRYLNLDAEGHAYRYLPPPEDSDSNGQYRPYRDLIAAIDALHLHEMPWLYGSGFEHDRRGLTWEQRWDHPAVRAWYERRALEFERRRRPRRAGPR